MRRPFPSGRKALVLFGVVAMAAVVGIPLTASPGRNSWVSRLTGSTGADIPRAPATKAKLRVTVSARGDLESSKNRDVVNLVEGQSTILFLKPEGSSVKKGELVCELDSSTFRSTLITQEIATKRAESALQVAVKTREIAEMTVREYLEGTYPRDEGSITGSIKPVEIELAQAKDQLEWSNRVQRLGYVTASQNRASRFSLERTEHSLREAKAKLKVLQQYTKVRQATDLQADVDKAISDELAKQATYQLEKSKEEKLRRQISYCKLLAPGDGLIVYANDGPMRPGDDGPKIQEGASIRERQRVIRLPDITQMRVNAKVDESQVAQLHQGQKAKIRVDAFPGLVLDGTVETVRPMSDPTGSGPGAMTDVRLYTALVSVDNPPRGIRPGMVARVEIVVSEADDALTIPVQAVLQFQGKSHVMVVARGEALRREVKLGAASGPLIEVRNGLFPGEEVALDPMSLMTDQERNEAFILGGLTVSDDGWHRDAEGRRTE